jgi:hypothetical protein
MAVLGHNLMYMPLQRDSKKEERSVIVLTHWIVNLECVIVNALAQKRDKDKGNCVNEI